MEAVAFSNNDRAVLAWTFGGKLGGQQRPSRSVVLAKHAAHPQQGPQRPGGHAPDLDEVFKIIGEAQQAIVFLVFEPDRGATTWDRPALQAATGGISPAVGPHSVHRRSPARQRAE